MNNTCDLISYYSLLVCSVATTPPSFPVSGHSHMLFPLSKIPFPQPLAWLTLTAVGFYWSYFSATVYANYLKHPSFPLDPTFLLPWPNILKKNIFIVSFVCLSRLLICRGSDFFHTQDSVCYWGCVQSMLVKWRNGRTRCAGPVSLGLKPQNKDLSPPTITCCLDASSRSFT